MTDWYRKENGEIDREKVIDELERDLVREPDEQTHIIGTFDREAVESALELLKAQEQEIQQLKSTRISASDNAIACGVIHGGVTIHQKASEITNIKHIDVFNG